MLTADTTLTPPTEDAAQPQSAPAPADVWLSISDLAGLKGVTKQAISNKVTRFETEGLISTRPGAGRAKMVNVAEYERAARDASHPLKQLAADMVRERRAAVDAQICASTPEIAARPDGDVAASPSAVPALTEAQTRKAVAEAELKRLDLAERRALLAPIAGPRGSEATIARIVNALLRSMERIPGKCDEVVAAVLKDGAHGARRLLQQLVTKAREEAAGEIGAMKIEGLAEENAGPYEVELALSEDP